MINEKEKTILLVEDEAIIAIMEEITLKKYGYKVITVDSGEKAIEAINKAVNIDLILMDINLGGGIDGTQAAEIILKDQEIPIVFLSSHTEPEIVKKTEGITSYGYIVKDSGETVLIASIKMAFRLFDARKKEKKNEEELNNTKILLEQAFRQSPIPMVLVSMPDAIVRIVNPACLEFLGIEDEPSYIGTSLMDYKATYKDYDLKGNLGSLSELPLARALKGEKTTNEERIIVRKDGTIRWELVNGVPIYDIKGEIMAGYLILIDITEKKSAEVALTEKEERFRLLSNNLSGGMVYQIDSGEDGLQRVFSYISNSVEQLHEVTAVKVEQDSMLIYGQVNEADQVIVAEKEKYALQTMSVFSVEIRFTLPSGKIRWGLLTSTPRRLSNNHLVWDGIEVDITEQKQAGLALQEEYKKTTEILNTIPSGLFIYQYIEPDKLILLSSNSEADNLTGISSKEWIGREFNEIWLNAKEYGITEKYLRVVKTGKNIEIEDIHYKDDRVDGIFRIRVFVIPGNKLGVAFENITKIKKAENEIKNLLEEKTLLLREVHHRMKNNISSIENLLILQVNSMKNSDALSSLEDAISRIKSMRVLYDNLLISENYKDISINNYFNKLIDTIISLFPNYTNIKIEKNIDEFTANTKIILPLGIIVNELITNAMKYAFTNSNQGILQITISKNKNKVSIIIKDNGIGLPPEFKADESKGFGFMLINMLIKQINGTLKIENNMGTKCIIEYEM